MWRVKDKKMDKSRRCKNCKKPCYGRKCRSCYEGRSNYYVTDMRRQHKKKKRYERHSLEVLELARSKVFEEVYKEVEE